MSQYLMILLNLEKKTKHSIEFTQLIGAQIVYKSNQYF